MRGLLPCFRQITHINPAARASNPSPPTLLWGLCYVAIWNFKMAIVPDLSGNRPGRPGNIPLQDPRNRSFKERMTNDDGYSLSTQVTLVNGNQLVIPADPTRNQLYFFTPDGSASVYINMTPLTSASGIPVYPDAGIQLRGDAASKAYYCWGVAGVVLTILQG